MLYVAGILVVLFGVAGIALTILTLPGTWLAVIVAALCTWWQPDLMSWWVVAAACALALLAEIVEFAASAVGTAKAGGTKHGGVGSLIGGIAGAIFGAPFFFGLGAIPGAVIGAFVGAVIGEKGIGKRSWADSTKSGKGAAVGRLVATVLKVMFAGAIALLLTIGSIVGIAAAPRGDKIPAGPGVGPPPLDAPNQAPALPPPHSEPAKTSMGIWELDSALPKEWPTLYAGRDPGSDVLARA